MVKAHETFNLKCRYASTVRAMLELQLTQKLTGGHVYLIVQFQIPRSNRFQEIGFQPFALKKDQTSNIVM